MLLILFCAAGLASGAAKLSGEIVKRAGSGLEISAYLGHRAEVDADLNFLIVRTLLRREPDIGVRGQSKNS